ncbi:hypothetical protein VNO77_27701 [Canavalia gladiata]|uniref:Uncharacterized protein n=1 Tax=Canavalia gladiata TaxID=3824 RepID=A0AAN9KUL6_CANGL
MALSELILKYAFGSLVSHTLHSLTHLTVLVTPDFVYMYNRTGSPTVYLWCALKLGCAWIWSVHSPPSKSTVLVYDHNVQGFNVRHTPLYWSPKAGQASATIAMVTLQASVLREGVTSHQIRPGSFTCLMTAHDNNRTKSSCVLQSLVAECDILKKGIMEGNSRAYISITGAADPKSDPLHKA